MTKQRGSERGGRGEAGRHKNRDAKEKEWKRNLNGDLASKTQADYWDGRGGVKGQSEQAHIKDMPEKGKRTTEKGRNIRSESRTFFTCHGHGNIP